MRKVSAHPSFYVLWVWFKTRADDQTGDTLQEGQKALAEADSGRPLEAYPGWAGWGKNLRCNHKVGL